MKSVGKDSRLHDFIKNKQKYQIWNVPSCLIFFAGGTLPGAPSDCRFVGAAGLSEFQF